MFVPAQRQHRPPTAPLMRALIRTAWAHGYTAVPRDGADHPALLLTPRGGLRAPRRGRIHLAPHGPHTLWWHWSDTGQPLNADPRDDRALITEVDHALRGQEDAR